MNERSRTRDLLDIVKEAPGPSSPAARVIMQRNKRRDSVAEVALRSELHRRGLRFRVDFPIRCGTGRPIRPDIVFTRARLAIFVDGCFWHGCEHHGRTPKSNIAYWEAKIELNRDRDRRQTVRLSDAGWRVLRVWEHEDPASGAARIVDALG